MTGVGGTMAGREKSFCRETGPRRDVGRYIGEEVSLGANEGPPKRPSKRLTSSKPSNRGSECEGSAGPFVEVEAGSDAGVEAWPINAMKIAKGCFGGRARGLSRNVVETVRHSKGSSTDTFRYAEKWMRSKNQNK